MYILKTLDNKKNNAIHALVRLADGVDGKSDAAKIREVIESVEMALSAGVCREKVLETIKESLGVSMSMKTFEKNLYRIRKKKKSEKLEAETPPKQNQQPIVRSDAKSDVANFCETKNKYSEEQKRFITPQERRDFGKNALKTIDDEENYIPED